MKATRIPDISRGTSFEIDIDGQKVMAYEGETLATVLMATGIRAFEHHVHPYAPSRLFCGMGTCQQCLVTIDDLPNCQACQTPVHPDMKVKTNHDK